MSFQGGIGEKGAEGTAGNDGARVRERKRAFSPMAYKPTFLLITLQACYKFNKSYSCCLRVKTTRMMQFETGCRLTVVDYFTYPTLDP